MRILHILDHFLPLASGYVFRTLGILSEQRARGWDTIQLTAPRQTTPFVASEVVDGWVLHRTPPPRAALGGLPILREWAEMRSTRARLEEVARDSRPDILHAHSPVLNAFPALDVGDKLGIPVVYEVRAFWEDAAVDQGKATEGGMRYCATRAMESRALRRAAAVTTICQGLRKDIVGRGVDPDKVTVIPNAVDGVKFTPARAPNMDLARSLGVDGKTVLGFVGSFYAYEGLDLLLEALPAILTACPEVRVLLVGGGPVESDLKSRTASLDLADRVLFTGPVPHDEVQDYYALIDLAVYPRRSVRLTETVTPLKPLEVMAQQKPLVASDVGGHRELIRDGDTGFLFPAGDVQALAKRVIGALGRRETWPEMGRSGRRFVDEERNWKASVAGYAHVYDTVLQRSVSS